jgi:chemotaxis response regulator CheB
MPKEAVARGAVDEVVALPRIAPAVLSQLRRMNVREPHGMREGIR